MECQSSTKMCDRENITPLTNGNYVNPEIKQSNHLTNSENSAAENSVSPTTSSLNSVSQEHGTRISNIS